MSHNEGSRGDTLSSIHQTSPKSATSSLSQGTNITTPEPSPTRITRTDMSDTNNNSNNFDDIWGSDSDDYDNRTIGLDQQPQPQQQHQQPETEVPNVNEDTNDIARPPTQTRPKTEQILSDLPHLKRQHMTSGYREGLSIGKAKVIQQGFDQGYPVGVAIALRAGQILGILEGYLSALSTPPVNVKMHSSATSRRDVTGDAKGNSNDESKKKRREKLLKIYESAKDQLAISNLMKGLSDEDVARIHGHRTTNDSETVPMSSSSSSATVGVGAARKESHDDNDEINNNEKDIHTGIPAEIERVLRKWEKLVL